MIYNCTYIGLYLNVEIDALAYTYEIFMRVRLSSNVNFTISGVGV